MATYTGTSVKDLDITTPTEGATPPSEMNDSVREVKAILKNQYAVATKAANYTLTAQDSVILANGAITLTLPQQSSVSSAAYVKEYTVINIGSGIVTLSAYAGDSIFFTGDSSISIYPGEEVTILGTGGTRWMERRRESVGTIKVTASPNISAGRLLIYGQAVSRTKYADLFAHLGTTFGVGDGSTTFNLPDLRGRTVVGLDNMGGVGAGRLTTWANSLGGSAGQESVGLTINEMPIHNHPVTDPGHLHSFGTSNAGGNTLPVAYGSGTAGTAENTNSATTGITINNTGGGAAHTNVQPSLALNYTIKA